MKGRWRTAFASKLPSCPSKERRRTMKRTMMTIAITLLTAATIKFAAARPKPSGPQARAINPPGSPEGLPFSNGILVGNTLYVAGIEAQTRAALENIRKIVEGAGMTMSNVVAVNVYLADINDFAKMNGVYRTFFPDPKPTRTTVQVARLVNDARIEISAIAVKPR